jgi:hypothetical protein
MTEAKFLFYGVHQRNGWNLPDLLACIAETADEALATIQRNNPDFLIIRWDVADNF